MNIEHQPATQNLAARALRDFSLLGWWAAFAVLYALQPRSGMGITATASWQDQGLFLRALTDTLANGTSELFTNGIVGPGYVTLARWLHAVGLPPAESLVTLGEISFVVTGMLMLAFTQRATAALRPGPRAALMVVSILVLFSSNWAYAADIPWTHFTETALVAGLVLLLSLPSHPLRHLLIGVLVVFAYQTRSYEGAVMLIALALVIVASVASMIMRRHPFELGRLASLAYMVVLGAGLADLAIWASTGIAAPFAQYSGDNGTAQLLWSLLPNRVMQLFVDTCFSTICDRSATTPISVLGFPDDLVAWRLPLSLQLPGLIAAGIASVALMLLSGSSRRAVLRPEILFALLVAGGVILAYTAAAMAGSPHLRYGFMRDYVAPMVLLAMALAGLAGAARAPAATWGGLLASLGIIVLMLLRPVAANPFPAQDLQSASYTASCDGGTCRFTLGATNLLGQLVSLSPLTVFYRQCGEQTEQGVADLGSFTYDTHACQHLTLLPAVAGLAGTPEPERYIGQPVLPSP